MPFNASGRWISVEQAERDMEPDEFIEDGPTTDVEIQEGYRRQVEARRMGSTIVGRDVEHTRDLQAFDAMALRVGFRRAVSALQDISDKAKQMKAAYFSRTSK